MIASAPMSSTGPCKKPKLTAKLGTLAFFAVLAVAFRAVGSFLSWAQRQEDAPANAWIDEDEDELEDA